jgi:hypothetical protein
MLASITIEKLHITVEHWLERKFTKQNNEDIPDAYIDEKLHFLVNKS